MTVFPEMRAQLRTYHAIPSLQHQDVSSYKQLQDAPRLKSILKGATEDIEQPGTIEDIMASKIPRTNPVNLIFVLAQAAPKISGIHFDVPRDFFDLVMKETLSSKSRAIAFLWLMWWYLESDFSVADALRNPYGPGRYAKDSESDLPLRCPPFEILTEEEAATENVDTPEEQEFGEQKRLEREAINNGQMPAVYSGPKRSKKSTANEPGLGAPLPGQQRVWRNKPPSKSAPRQSLDVHSDSDRTISPPPKGGVKISNLLNEDSAASTPAKGSGRGNWRRKDGDGNPRSTPKDMDGSSMFMPYQADTPTATGSSKRQRAPTSHQRTVESKRKALVDDILYDGLEKVRRVADRRRTRSTMTTRVLARMKDLSPQYDSEDEAQKIGHGRIGAARMGVTMGGFGQVNGEASEYGAEAWNMAKTFNRLRRKLQRKWDSEDMSSAKRQRRDEDAMDIDGNENGAYDADESRMQIRAGADDEWSDGDE
jgi:Ino eighty subunit 1